mgnify:CR=1 FL=1
MGSTLRWASRSDTGRVRLQNEDCVHADGDVFIVADGMGGHLAGEVASALAVATIVEKCTGGVSSLDQFGEALREANRRVIGESDADPNREGMGTTVVAVARITGAADQSLALANVGDSRAYLFDSTGMRQLSKDHSLVQELVDDGIIARDDARHHPRRNIVTRALGIDPEVSIDLWELVLPEGSRILLCSDGLVDEVDETAIEEILATESDPEIAADRLIRLANDNGGRDNVSLVLLQMVGGSKIADPTVEIAMIPTQSTVPVDPILERRRSEKSRIRLFALILLVLIVVIFGGAFAVSEIRSGFTVTFDEGGDVVVLHGRGILWFEPTLTARGPISRTELDVVSRDLVERAPRFDTLRDAETFVAEALTASDGNGSESDR